MADDLKPTESDMQRDLAADLRICEAATLPRSYLREGWPAAIRRALAAEAFKAWVHAWLDAQGVLADPDPEHTKETGCRISGRMRCLLNRALDAEAKVAVYERALDNLRVE